MLRRTVLIVAIGSLAGSLASHAQRPPTVRRIGFLRSGSMLADTRSTEAFLGGMRELGWVDGQNLAIEYRWADGRSERLPDLASELASLPVELIVVSSTPGAQAATHATTKIPIVFGMVSDPVASGIVNALARPGGNATGWSNALPDSSGKLVQLAKELVPTASRVAVLWSPANPGKKLEFAVIQSTAQSLGVTIHSIEVPTLQDLESGLSKLASMRPDALITFVDAVTSTGQKRIVEFAAKQRLPAVYQGREFVTAGGLISYAPNIEHLWRRTAYFVDKILKGAKPADLPVEQPTLFELVINTKAANALGLAIPSPILMRATELIR